MSNRHRKKRKRKKNRSAHDNRRRADRKWFQRHPEMIPTKCADCNKQVPLQFHHERYDVPRTGRFLCEFCHMKQHGTKPNWEKRMAKEKRKNKYWMYSKKYKEMEKKLEEEKKNESNRD